MRPALSTTQRTAATVEVDDHRCTGTGGLENIEDLMWVGAVADVELVREPGSDKRAVRQRPVVEARRSGW